MADFREVVKSRLFGGKVKFRSDTKNMSDEDQKEPQEAAPAETPAEEAAPEVAPADGDSTPPEVASE
jgi:hypothetical protein